MFSNKKQEKAIMRKPISIDKADIKAFLGPGSRFEGTLSFDEMVRLDGVFSGEIKSSDTLIVGESAEIDGKIQVGSLILSGHFKGDIKATTSVELRAPAQVEGSIDSPIIKIDEKVIFNGEIKMTESPKRDAAKEVSREKKK